ncbi:unnamed protein product [Brassica oleracea var. botrytis]
MIPTGKRNAATLQIRPKGHQLPHSLYRHCDKLKKATYGMKKR